MKTHRVDLEWPYDRITLDPMILITIRQHNAAAGRHSHTRIIHKKQMDTTDVNIMTHTTFTQSNLSVLSAVLILFVNLYFLA